MKISRRVSEFLSGHYLHNFVKKLQAELSYLFSSHCLVMVYICKKACEIILKGFRVADLNSWVDTWVAVRRYKQH